MFRKLLIIGIVFLLIFTPVIAYCGDNECEKDENTNNCCEDCGCSLGEKCENNQCVEQLTFLSFSPEISIFLLTLILLLALFIVGYGFGIVRKAHEKTKKHFEDKDNFSFKEKNESQKEETFDNLDNVDLQRIKSSFSDEEIFNKVMDYIKRGKTIEQIRKELIYEDIDPNLVDDIILEVIDSITSKAEQGLLSINWDPRIVDYVFREIMKRPKSHKLKKRRIHHIKKPKLKKITKKSKIKKEKDRAVSGMEKYIGIALARGYSKGKIKDKLIKAGWNSEDIDRLLEKFIK